MFFKKKETNQTASTPPEGTPPEGGRNVQLENVFIPGEKVFWTTEDDYIPAARVCDLCQEDGTLVGQNGKKVTCPYCEGSRKRWTRKIFGSVKGPNAIEDIVIHRVNKNEVVFSYRLFDEYNDSWTPENGIMRRSYSVFATYKEAKEYLDRELEKANFDVIPNEEPPDHPDWPWVG